MTTTYTLTDARAIWDVSLAMVTTVTAALQAEGWTTNDQYGGDRWEMWGERPVGDDGWEEFSVTVLRDGRTASFSGDVPEPVRVLARAMMAVAGPYLDANSQD